MSLTATSVRPRSPCTPGSFLTLERRVGGGGWGKKTRRTFPQREGTGPPRKKRSNARRAHGLGSEPSTEWPVAGATTSCACGNRAATRLAFSTGVRRSSSPSSRSTGTFGSGAPAGGGAGLATGQRPQSVIRSLSSTVARSKGRKSESGRAVTASRASRRRTAGSGGVLRAQGKGVSSQVVAAYSAALRIRGGGGRRPP